MGQNISRQLLKRLMWGIGVVPLMMADLSIAIASSQIPTPRQQLAQSNPKSVETCPSVQGSLDAQAFRQIIQQLTENIDQCSDAELDILLTDLQQAIGAPTTEATALAQITALHSLSWLVSQVDAPIVEEAELLTWLLKIEPLLAETSQFWQVKSAAVTLFEAIAIRTLEVEGLDSEGISNAGGLTNEITRIFRDSIALNALQIEDAEAFREQLSTSDNSPENAQSARGAAQYRAQVAHHLATLRMIKAVGQELQQQMVREVALQVQLMQEGKPVPESPFIELRQFLAAETADLLKKQLVEMPEVEDANSVAAALLVDIKVATVETLAAVVFPDDPSEDAMACPLGDFEDLDKDLDIETIPPLCLLNKLAAKASESNQVRAAAIASLEQLGSLKEPFHSFVVDNLYSFAQFEPTADQSDQAPDDSTQAAERIFGIDIASRIEGQRTSQRQQVPARPILGAITPTEPNLDGALAQRTDVQTLSRLLRPGFEQNSNNELRQTAETAFRQIYENDVDKLVQAANWAIRENDQRTQLAAVKAAGGINYRRIEAIPSGNEGVKDPPKSLKALSIFLAKSLESNEADIRRRAAYALGQMAAYWSPVFQESFDSKLHNGNISVLEALLLGLNDNNAKDEATENVIASVAFALSRYGIALDQTQKRTELIQITTGKSGLAQPGSGDLDTLKACLMATMAPVEDDLNGFNIAKRLIEFNITTDEQTAQAIKNEWLATSRRLDPTKDDHKENSAVPCTLQIIETRVPENLDRLPDTDRTSVAAAFTLGQIGISDGEKSASSEEQQTIKDLLWILQVRDVLATNTVSNRYAPDSVRDSIANYTFGQINHREHELIINCLLRPVSFPGDLDIEASDNDEQVFSSNVCEDTIYLHNPFTRAVVIEAFDQIGLKADSLRAFVRRTRRLLAQDEDESNRVQAAVARVIQRSNDRADEDLQTLLENLQANLQELDEKEAQGGAQELEVGFSQALMDQSLFFLNRLNNLENNPAGDVLFDAAQDLTHVRRLLSLPYNSLLACAGANYGLESIGINDDFTVKERLEQIYVFPKPYAHICASNRWSVSNLENSGPRPPVVEEPALVEQLVLMKSGAIAALGQIDPNYKRLSEVVNCLASLAQDRGSLIPTNNCPINLEKEGSANELRNRAEDWCLTPFQLEEFRKHEYYSTYQAFDSLEYGLTSSERLGDRLTEPGCPEEALIKEERLPERLPDEEQFPAQYQAEGWGLSTTNAAEYLYLRQELRRPAMEALGQIALRESGNDALNALIELTPPKRDNTLESSQDESSRDEGRQQDPRLLQIDLLASVAFALQSSDLSNGYSQQQLANKITPIVNFLVGLINPKLENLDDIKVSDAAVYALARIEPSAFASRADLVTILGITSENPSSPAAVCLSQSQKNKPASDEDEENETRTPPENAFLRRENLCLGLVNVLSGISNYQPRTRASVDTFLAKLAKDPESAVIQSNAIQAIGELNRDVSGNYRLLSERLGNDEPRVIYQVIQAFLNADPNEGGQVLGNALDLRDGDFAWQAAHAIRLLGQVTFYGIEAAEESGLSSNDPDYALYLSWQTALTSPDLTLRLVDRLNDEVSIPGPTDKSIKLINQIIYALGELRTRDSAIQTLERLLNNRNTDPSTRAAAAYALGKIGNEHSDIGRDVLPSLHRIAVDENGAESIELQATAAYSISQIGRNAYQNLAGIDPTEVLDALLTTYHNAKTEGSDTLRAILLYAMGGIGFEDNRILEAFAESLDPNQPSNIRVIAATYANRLFNQELACEPGEFQLGSVDNYDCTLPRWNENLTNALISAATSDRDVTVRRNAAISLGNRVNFVSTESNQYYQDRILENLAEVFWNEREYPSVRTAAGASIKTLSSGNKLTVAFEATLEDLELVEQLRAGLRSPELRSPDQALFSIRSSTLINALDANLRAEILLIILDEIRTGVRNIPVGTGTVAISSKPFYCKIRGTGRLPRCR
ncbi:HEAT repeat domain-containing protein [Leptothoe sp. EHU-05/26/07-4]